MSVPLTDYADLGPQDKAQFEAMLSSLTSLERVLAWGRSQRSPYVIDEILTQDEYTHDVMMAVEGGRYLVFDTT
jgi:hypothetical protein